MVSPPPLSLSLSLSLSSGALDALAVCLEEFDPGVKEAAAWALGYIARHDAGIYIYILHLTLSLPHGH